MLRVSSATWGLAAGIAIAQLMQRRAGSGALSFSPVLQIVVIVCFVFLGGAIGALWSRRVRGGWSFHLTWIALASTPLSLIAGGGLSHVVVHALVAGAATGFGSMQPRFSRTDVILIPTTMAVYFAALEIVPAARPITLFLASVIVVLELRVAIKLTPRAIPKKVLALGVYPIFIFVYPLVLLGVSGPMPLDFFEDGHHLLPAAEMARGERPYADIVPVHGLLSDGGIEALFIRMGYTDASDLLRVRRIISCLNLVAIYFAALAATASMEGGFLAVVFALCAIPSGTIWIRSIGGIFALAASLAGVRTQRHRWFIAAGVLIVIAWLFGPEFAVYSAVASLVAVARMRQRLLALGSLAIGFVSAAILVLVALGPVFIRVTVTELLPAGRVYVPGPLVAPAAFTSFNNFASNVIAAQSLPALLWFVAVITSAAMLMRRPSRADGAWVIGVWIAIASISWAQRRHEYYIFLLGPFVVAALLWLRRRNRRAFIAGAILIGVLANPMQHLFGVATPLRRSEEARAMAPPEVEAGIAAAGRFVSSQLKPDETWFDFSNSAALYFFLKRESPTRHHQVPFYQSEQGQREVIQVLASNPKVAAVLLSFPGGMSNIDGVPNSERAPLVAEFIRTRFRPAFEEHGVVFWVRR